MIITRSPLRISFGGGGTDLPSYYRKHSGFLIAAAIDKYVYITLHQTFVEELIIKYSKMERVSHADAVQHPIIREALCLVGIPGPYLELTSMADIPAGTGLGSSGSFTTALLKALHTYKKNLVHHRELAEQACHIEIDLLSEPIGKQDQYAAALGGIDAFVFTAGIGENSIEVRALVAERIAWLGATLDPEANATGKTLISRADSRVAVMVIPTDEELMIARHTLNLLLQQGTPWTMAAGTRL